MEDEGVLSPAERLVLTETARGNVADVNPAWSIEDRTVRASLLRQLLLKLPRGDGFDPPYPVSLSGVRVRNAIIQGPLDLQDCSGPAGHGLPALELFACEIPDPVDLSHARVARLSFQASTFREIRGVGLHVDGLFDISLSGFPAASEDEEAIIDLTAAIVEGDVVGEGARLRCRPRPGPRDPSSAQYALRLSDATIVGSVNLNREFTAIGGVTISASLVRGEVWLTEARIVRGEGAAFNARGATVEGQVMMIDGFHAEGRVMWRGARIGGDLSMGRERSASYREETQRKESKIDGELDLRGAVIAGSLELGGAALNNAGSWAINAAGVQIGRDLTIRSENFLTQVQGGLRFEGARIEGEVLWDGLQFSGAGPGRTLISLADAQITRALKPKRLIVAESVREKPRKGETALLIDLAGAHCAALDDDLDQGWGPVSVHLAMDGFVYQRLQREKRTEKGTDSSDRWKKRKKWMRERFQRYEGYHAQPYAHLARLYGEAGWYDDMRQVLWHRQVQQLRHEERRIWVRPFLHLHDLVAGFGHAPHRAAISLIAFLVIGTIGFEIANRRGALVVDVKAVAVNADKPLTSMPSPPACGREISPALYALDVAIPLLDLMQESECEPGKAPGAKLFEGVHIPAFKLRLLEEVEVWRWAKALYGILGAILTAVSVLTFTGVMRTVRLD